jgi:hypothetical protein
MTDLLFLHAVIDFLLCTRYFLVRCSPHILIFWERTASVCIIHLCFVFTPPNNLLSYCISFLRISLSLPLCVLFIGSVHGLPLWRTFLFGECLDPKSHRKLENVQLGCALSARSAPRTRYTQWSGGSRSQTHRRSAKGGFTQDDG